MTIKECPNCPGRDDHDAEHCPIKPAWQIDSEGVLRNANGEWVAELAAWDKEKLEAMLDGEAPSQDSPNVEWPVSLMESALTGKPATGRCITCNCTTRCGKLFCEDHSYLAPVDQPSAAQSAPEHSTQDDYEHFLSYSGLNDDPMLRYAYFHGADAECEKPSAPAVAVAQGWRLVPDDMTPEMYTAFCETRGIVGTTYKDGWRAALAAAPAQPAAQDKVHCSECGLAVLDCDKRGCFGLAAAQEPVAWTSRAKLKAMNDMGVASMWPKRIADDNDVPLYTHAPAAQDQGEVRRLREAVARADDVLAALTACTTPLARLERKFGKDWCQSVDKVRSELISALAASTGPEVKP